MPMPFTKPLLYLGLLGMLLLNACTVSPPTPSEATAKTVDVDPAAKAEFEQAVAVLKTGQRTVALQLFEKMAQRYPQLTGIQVNIGIIYLQDNNPEQAIKSLKQAIAINPDNASAHHHLGIAYRQLGDFKAAQQAYLQALKINPDYANAHLNLGILYDIYLQQLDAALQHYQQYQQLSGTPDQQVAKWIVDLERRMKTNNKSTGG